MAYRIINVPSNNPDPRVSYNVVKSPCLRQVPSDLLNTAFIKSPLTPIDNNSKRSLEVSLLLYNKHLINNKLLINRLIP